MSLALSVTVGESLVIKAPGGEEIWIRVGKLQVRGETVLGKVTLETSAPGNYEIDREAIYLKKRAQREAAKKNKPPS